MKCIFYFFHAHWTWIKLQAKQKNNRKLMIDSFEMCLNLNFKVSKIIFELLLNEKTSCEIFLITWNRQMYVIFNRFRNEKFEIKIVFKQIMKKIQNHKEKDFRDASWIIFNLNWSRSIYKLRFAMQSKECNFHDRCRSIAMKLLREAFEIHIYHEQNDFALETSHLIYSHYAAFIASCH